VSTLYISRTLFAFSLVALGFLAYTLLNLKNLGVPSTHPRVIVEFSLFVTFLVAALVLDLLETSG
jgi:hypothetical protein